MNEHVGSQAFQFSDMPLVFICSPYSGDVKANTENAKRYAKYAARSGNAVFVPHLMYPQFLDDTVKSDRELGIQSGIEFLRLCNEIWVFAKDEVSCTAGMKRELEEARQNPMVKIKFVDPSRVP